MAKYHVIRYDNDMEFPNTTEYDTDVGSIREVAQMFGRARDTLELWHGNKLIAMATWPFGSKVYKYCTGNDLNANPSWCIWRY